MVKYRRIDGCPPIDFYLDLESIRTSVAREAELSEFSFASCGRPDTLQVQNSVMQLVMCAEADQLNTSSSLAPKHC